MLANMPFRSRSLSVLHGTTVRLSGVVPPIGRERGARRPSPVPSSRSSRSLEVMGAYPVAGTQLVFATLLCAVAAVVCVHDGLTDLAALARPKVANPLLPACTGCRPGLVRGHFLRGLREYAESPSLRARAYRLPRHEVGAGPAAATSSRPLSSPDHASTSGPRSPDGSTGNPDQYCRTPTTRAVTSGDHPRPPDQPVLLRPIGARSGPAPGERPETIIRIESYTLGTTFVIQPRQPCHANFASTRLVLLPDFGARRGSTPPADSEDDPVGRRSAPPPGRSSASHQRRPATTRA